MNGNHYLVHLLNPWAKFPVYHFKLRILIVKVGMGAES